jgi:hypothetical protein
VSVRSSIPYRWICFLPRRLFSLASPSAGKAALVSHTSSSWRPALYAFPRELASGLGAGGVGRRGRMARRSPSPAPPQGSSRRSTSTSRRRSRSSTRRRHEDTTLAAVVSSAVKGGEGGRRGREETRRRDGVVKRARSPVPADAGAMTRGFAFLNESLNLTGAFLGDEDAAMKAETIEYLKIIKSRSRRSKSKDRAERMLWLAKMFDLCKITIAFLFLLFLVGAAVLLAYLAGNAVASGVDRLIRVDPK